MLAKRRSLLASTLLALALPVVAAQLDSATYFGLDRGMSESELLLRAGPPDLVTHPGGEVISRRSTVGVVEPEDPRLRLIGAYQRRTFVEIKQYHYIPDHTEHDPHLTVVTLRGGRIFEIERPKLLTRPKAPPAPTAAASSPVPSDAQVRIEQVDRVLSAAEAYAATRARLKAQASEAAKLEAERGAVADDASGSLYRGTGTAGETYFGDRPVGN